MKPPTHDVLIDVTRLVDRALKGRLPTGVDRVSLEYIRHFRPRAVALVRFAGRWVAMGPGDSGRVFDALLAPDRRAAGTFRRCVAANYLLPGLGAGRPRLFLNTGHSGLDRPDYAFELRRRGLLPVFFLHDLIPLSHPEYCRPGEAEKHRRRLDTMLSAGRGLIVNSAATLAMLERHAGREGRPLPPCAIAPLAAHRLPPPSPARPLAPPYFVCLSTIEARKNHLLLLQLWRKMAAELGDETPRLVLIGQRGWECEQVADLLDRCEALRGCVIECPHCEDGELASHLHHAQALLFPSFEEGYGMPLVEALGLGTPALVSDLPVFHEIAGGIPEYLDPLDGAGWQRTILDYAAPDSRRRAAQMARMADFRPPTWEGHFSRVDALIRQIAPGLAARLPAASPTPLESRSE